MAQQPEFQDYYKTLGVPRTASQAEIKKAFRKLARESHPDKHAGDKVAERRFKEINEANAVLSDPAKRSKYDQFGRDWEAYARAGAAAGGPSGDPFGPGGPFAGFGFGGGRGGSAGSGRAGGAPGGVRYEFRTSGDAGAFSDFFHMMFGDESAAAGEPEVFTGNGESMDDLLARLGMAGAAGAGRSGGSRSRVGSTGAGTGAARSKPQPVEVTIPRGAATGSRIRLTGKGPSGRDLIVVTKLKPHPVFTRRGDDLEREVPVTLREALLGSEIPIGTLKGRVLLKIPAETQSGRTFRLKGQGMPAFKGDSTGDLFVRVRVVLPTDLSDEAKAAAERFLDLVPQPDPRA
jgi:DnaJ-class molecular chaperone